MKLKKIVSILCLCLSISIFAHWSTAHAQSAPTNVDNGSDSTPDQALSPDRFYKAKALQDLSQGNNDEIGQKIELQILDGDEKGKIVTAIDDGRWGTPNDPLRKGETMVVEKAPNPASDNNGPSFNLTDRYRFPEILFVSILFLVVTLYLGRSRGFGSILGLAFSVLMVFYYIIPHILNGSDPFWICIIGGTVIIVLSLYISHGFNRRTSIALVSSLLSLGMAIGIDLLFVTLTRLNGTGTEDAMYLQTDNLSLNLKGILLGSIIIGVLGVLDDVTTGQSSAIEEIHQTDKNLGFYELYKKGLSIGREHIASLVNTLVLAYAGASFPLLLLYYNDKTAEPLWLTLNQNFMAEEIIRTLVGSMTLVLAVPLTTLIAAYYYSRSNQEKTERIAIPH
jgi:uncharacterized membrane protein